MTIENIKKLFYYETEKDWGNFGDLISRYIYKKITNIEPEHYFNSDIDTFQLLYDKPHFFMCGSIINYANEHSLIYGSGIIEKYCNLSKINCNNIFCVRGPHTLNLLKEYDKLNHEIGQGDIGLLCKYFYNPIVKKNNKIGVILNLDDYSIVEKYINYNYCDSDNIKFINLYIKNDDENIENKIKEIIECEYIISSSLHGVVIAQLYNIPQLWIKINNNKSDIKFSDYFSSVYQSNYLPQVNLYDVINNEKFDKFKIIEKINDYKFPIYINNRINDLFIFTPFINIKLKRIIYIIGYFFDYTHLINALENSKYFNYIKFVNCENLNEININTNDIYIVSSLISDKLSVKFLEYKKNNQIKYLGIFVTGNVDFCSVENLNLFDVIYYETLYSYKMSYLKHHNNSIRAFGIDTSIFNKNYTNEKIYDYIFVGSLNDSLKKFSLLNNLEIGSKILLVGNINSASDSEIIENLKKKYIISVVNRCSILKLRYYYSICKKLILTQPVYGGGERALLEAKYMNLNIEIIDNIKLKELNEENIFFDINFYSKQIDIGLKYLLNIN